MTIFCSFIMGQHYLWWYDIYY